jgi:hypothetical protein
VLIATTFEWCLSFLSHRFLGFGHLDTIEVDNMRRTLVFVLVVAAVIGLAEVRLSKGEPLLSPPGSVEVRF